MDEPHHSRKHQKHGMTMQVVARPDGTPLWCSRALPGRTHDLTAARAQFERDAIAPVDSAGRTVTAVARELVT